MEESDDRTLAQPDAPVRESAAGVIPSSHPRGGVKGVGDYFSGAGGSGSSGCELDALLSRLGTDLDSGKLEALCEGRARDRALLIDTDRLVARCVATAFDSRASLGDPDRKSADDGWLLPSIDSAIDDLLLLEEESDGAILHERNGPCGGVHTTLMMSLGVEAALSRRAARDFNALSSPVRQVFFALVCNGLTQQECSSRGLGTMITLARDLRVAVETLLKRQPVHQERNKRDGGKQ